MAYRTLDVSKRSTKATALAKKFASRIVSQSDAVNAMIDLVDKYTSGMYDKSKPIGSLLFLGPTGTGKTGSVEAFVEGLFGIADKMMKVDCAEFQHSHEIAKLQGSPPGYLGHRETSPYFTNASIKAARCDAAGNEVMPFTVVLFDEIEKASDALWQLLLGILDKKTMTTGTNEKVDFGDTIIIMTSNVGAGEMAADDNALGFAKPENDVDDAKLKDIAMNAARRKFMPEFLNRLDKIVMFKTLTKEDLGQVRSLMLEKVQMRIVLGSKVLFEIRVTNAGLDKLLEDGYDKRYNARHLSRTIESNISLPLTRLVTTGQIQDNDVIVCDYLKDKGEWRYIAVARGDASPSHGFTSSLSA
jgi:ATP-dependent Clp protease ATP-binding subunit ClpB